MPSLLATAGAKADLSLRDEEILEKAEDHEGWETIQMDGQTFGVYTSAMVEKCQTFETLVIYCSTLGPRFAPDLSQMLEVTLPCLRFYFHEGVREACAMIIPEWDTDQMVSTTFLQLIRCISSERDSTFLASLYKYFSDSLRVVGGPDVLSQHFHEDTIDATKQQLQSLIFTIRIRCTLGG